MSERMPRPRGVLLGLLALGIWASAPLAAAEDARPVTPPSAASDPRSGEGPAPGARPRGAPATSPTRAEQPITYKDERLSVRVKDRPLQSVLKEVSRLSGVRIFPHGTVGGHLVSVEFEGLALDEGLRRLLADRADYFFFYTAEREDPAGKGPRPKSPARLKTVWVYPQGEGVLIEPVPPSEWASTKELRARLADPDPRARADAIQGLIEREGNRAQAEVLQALQDPDGRVRTQALFWALEEGISLPEEQVKHLAFNDPSSSVRVLALRYLSTHPDARQIAQRALNDPDVYVRRLAEETLRRLDGASRRAEQPESPAGQELLRRFRERFGGPAAAGQSPGAGP